MRSCSNFSGALRSTPIRENTGGLSFRFRTASSPTSSAPGWKVWADLDRQRLGDHEGTFPVTFRRDGAAGDETAPNGSAHVCHEDEDCAGRELCGTGYGRRARYDVEPPELTN